MNTDKHEFLRHRFHGLAQIQPVKICAIRVKSFFHLCSSVFICG
jgi:hypothetical protein